MTTRLWHECLGCIQDSCDDCQTYKKSGKLSLYSKMKQSVDDAVSHPRHYTNHPSGVECIQITEHMNFNLGNALKYIWRCDLKRDAIEDLNKAKFYIDREISLRNENKAIK